ncbi:hva22 domain membrane protein [Nannochloropsis oceanica]
MIYHPFRIGILYVYPIIASCRTALRYHPYLQKERLQQPNIPESTSSNSTPHRNQIDNNDSHLHDVEHWCLYWLVSSILTLLLERPVDALVLSWVPSYRWIKLIFFLWLALPRFQGAARLYYLIVHPWLIQHETEIDAARGKAWEAAKVGGRKLAVAAVSVATAAVAGPGEGEGERGQGQRQGSAGGGRVGGGLAVLGGVSGFGGLRALVSEALWVVLASLTVRAGGEGGGGGGGGGGGEGRGEGGKGGGGERGSVTTAAVAQTNNRQRRGRPRHGLN